MCDVYVTVMVYITYVNCLINLHDDVNANEMEERKIKETWLNTFTSNAQIKTNLHTVVNCSIRRYFQIQTDYLIAVDIYTRICNTNDHFLKIPYNLLPRFCSLHISDFYYTPQTGRDIVII